jgi:hypothetical protein
MRCLSLNAEAGCIASGGSLGRSEDDEDTHYYHGPGC